MENKVLVVGANGFLGANISLFFADQGFDVTALCHRNPQEKSWNQKIKRTICCDLADLSIWDELSNDKFKYIIYLVSLNHTDSEGDLEYVNRINILALWSAAKTFCGKVDKFIYLSTQQVYGKIEGNYMNEDTICKPANIYGLTHLQCEGILTYYSRKSLTEYISIRLSNSYGVPALENRGCWTLVVNELCRSVVKEGLIELKSDGSPLRDFIYIDDVAKAVHLLCASDTLYDVYNLSSGVSYSIAAIAQKVQKRFEQIVGRHVEIKIPDGLTLSKTSDSIHIDNCRFKKLGLDISVNIDEGIDKLLNSLLK